MKFKLMNADALIIQQGLPVNWQSINQAIVDRWSLAELRKIKELAWSGECFK